MTSSALFQMAFRLAYVQNHLEPSVSARGSFVDCLNGRWNYSSTLRIAVVAETFITTNQKSYQGVVAKHSACLWRLETVF